MRARSRGRPRYLIEKPKVSADYALGLIVVVKAQNGKPVLGGVKDMHIPRFLGERKQCDYRRKPETRPRNLIARVPGIPPGSQARTRKGLDWCAIVNAFDISSWQAGQSEGGQ